MKCCTKCGVVKLHVEFSRQSKAPDGLQRWCKVCSKEHSRTYHPLRYVKDREKIIARTAAWARANPEKVRVHGRIKASQRLSQKNNALDPTASTTAIAELYHDAALVSRFIGEQFDVDHRVPLSRGGNHHQNNLRLLPSRLNRVKGARLDEEVTDPEFIDYISNKEAA